MVRYSICWFAFIFSALHYMQCGRAVKIISIMFHQYTFYLDDYHRHDQ